MASCAFLFDFVVVRIDAPSIQIENKKLLTVEASFNNIPLRVTSSRINVVEFKPRRSFEFNSTPEDLKRDLSVCPLKLSVFYDSNFIGSAEMPWNDFVLDRIKPGMGDLTHIDETKLLDLGETHVGTMEYILRLQCKCEEPSDEIMPTAVDDIKNQVRNIIDPNDVLFIVTQPNKEEACPDNDYEPSGEGTRPVTALDLSPYRVLNGRLVQNTNVINTCHDMDCCDFLKGPNYQRVNEPFGPCNKKKKPSEYACQAPSHCKECPHENKYSTHCSSSSEVFLGDFKSAPCSQRNPKLVACGLDIPYPDNRMQVPKTPRNCPICNTDLRWLPKLATCPQCGYKPVPVNIEQPYDENLTATDILKQYLENRSSESCTDVPKKSSEKGQECRCSCTYGKVCANCRVRKQCEEFLQPREIEEDVCGKCADDSDECANNKECRPQLARVFSELKDLFNVTPMKPGTEITNEKCERELNPPKENVKTRGGQRKSTEEAAAAAAAQNLELSPCYCSKEQKKTKRYRKKRGQFCSKTTKAICRAPPAEPVVSTKEEFMQKFHEACINRRRNVPGNMGWLWNLNTDLGSKWRPGAIRKPVKEIMRYFLRDFPADTIPISRYSYPHRRGHGKCNRDDDDEEDLMQQPTLHICKKNGEVYITLRPLKNPEALKYCANPYLNMQPIQFKIVKNPLAAEIKKMKQCLKDMGYPNCTCNRPIVECFCRSFLDKQRLEYQLRKECKKRGLEDYCESLRLSDTSDSEAEYDFSVTPPAGLIKKERARRPDKVNVGTQYERCDWNPPVVSPLPPNIYMKWINCATGHKYVYRRASDLLTIGQKEAILCQKRKEEELAQKKAGKGRKLNQAPATEFAPPRDYIQKCPDGTKVNMRKYLDAKPKAKK